MRLADSIVLVHILLIFVRATKISKELFSAHQFKPEGNPHTMVVLVKCEEGVLKREKITYVATS